MVVKRLKTLYLYFWLYAVLGWIYEVFLETVVYQWGFSNRGFLFGPYCPVYGFGAVLILLVLGPLRKKRILVGKINITPLLVFIGIVVLTTTVELLTSYLMEWTTGGWLWDYRSYPFHFQGRIALNPSIRFGIGGMVILYGLQPLLEKMRNKMGEQRWNTASTVLFIVMMADFIWKIWKG
ncbi:putative ABC transporter permease [Anaerotignum lactatifermentans]|uniref:ABC transporter permease n=1 Tax=Anaerotignum lactatifermentans TaxID=160404 RepID=A0ABS2GBT3_9FIRM|nr:putative ABC transporter permease [Anaerotignum lactatifermentans]MBM6828547.1 putative ABC transporter permease [Anaerotignum lactatifermentans]MBM6877954.1 putative ABC transporter permease [Anaerotignum lactatifermentans]MBM6950129.1 putative ABC transporter permease [Anaerotignum lactatifermentans]